MAQASSARCLEAEGEPKEQTKKALTVKTKRKIVFDSSFLLAVMEHPTPWEDDILQQVGAYSPVVLASVKEELARLAGKPQERARFAVLALDLVERSFILEQDARGRPDDEIISFSLKEGAAVATVDSDLARRLRAASTSSVVVTLRGGRVARF